MAAAPQSSSPPVRRLPALPAGSPLHLALPQLVDAIAGGRIAALDLARACIERVEAVEPVIHAFKGLDAEAVLEQARQIDASLRAGRPAGLLAGLPFGVKDIIDVAGRVTGMGSPIHDADVATRDAALVVRLRAAGAHVLGKTVTTEFAFMQPRETRNPWNPAHTPGGSSSGSAAAVAAGCVPVALCTQTNGSVIRPAAFCGVVGFKPSFGAFSTQGVLSYAPTLDQAGCYARTVAGVARIAQALCEPGHRIGAASASATSATSPASATPASPARAPRLLAVHSPVWHLAGEPMQREFARCCGLLAAAGAQVEVRELPASFERAHDTHRVIMAFEAWGYFAAVQAAHRGLLSDWLNGYLDAAASIDEGAYREALVRRAALREAYARFIAGHDALLTPPATGEAPPGIETSGDPVFCSIWTLLGTPAITVPSGPGPLGLPLGLQIVGAERDDDRLLGVAAWCEARLAFAGLIDRPHAH